MTSKSGATTTTWTWGLAGWALIVFLFPPTVALLSLEPGLMGRNGYWWLWVGVCCLVVVDHPRLGPTGVRAVGNLAAGAVALLLVVYNVAQSVAATGAATPSDPATVMLLVALYAAARYRAERRISAWAEEALVARLASSTQDHAAQLSALTVEVRALRGELADVRGRGVLARWRRR